ELLASLLEDIDEQRTVPQPQDPGAVTMAPLLRAEDGWVDWTLPAAAIERRIRAFDPWPGQAATSVKGKLHILEARGRAAAEDDAAGPTAPGAAADQAAAGGARRLRGKPHPGGAGGPPPAEDDAAGPTARGAAADNPGAGGGGAP